MSPDTLAKTSTSHRLLSKETPAWLNIWLNASSLPVHFIIPIGLKCLKSVTTYFSFIKSCNRHPGSCTEASPEIGPEGFSEHTSCLYSTMHIISAPIPLKKAIRILPFFPRIWQKRIALCICWFLGAVQLLWLCPDVELHPVGLSTAPWVTNLLDCIFIKKTYINAWTCWGTEHSSHAGFFLHWKKKKKKSHIWAIFWSGNNGQIS